MHTTGQIIGKDVSHKLISRRRISIIQLFRDIIQKERIPLMVREKQGRQNKRIFKLVLMFLFDYVHSI